MADRHPQGPGSSAESQSTSKLPAWADAKLIVAAITGDACTPGEDVLGCTLAAIVGDLEMLAQASINDEGHAVTDTTQNDYTEQLYRITRRAKAGLALARLIEAADQDEKEQGQHA